MTDEESSARNGTRCFACMERLAPGATKCSHCGSFQNWRRYLGLSSVVLSLLVALISVSTVGISVFKDVIIPKRAELNILILKQEGELTFQLLVRNAGNAPGLISIMSRPLVRNGEDWDVTLYPYDPEKREYRSWPVELSANSFEVMKVRGRLRSAPDMAATKEKFGCKLEFTVIQLTGDETGHEVSCAGMNAP